MYYDSLEVDKNARWNETEAKTYKIVLKHIF